MIEFREKMMALLNEYYGESRDEAHKEEIIDFLEANANQVHDILWTEID